MKGEKTMEYKKFNGGHNDWDYDMDVEQVYYDEGEGNVPPEDWR